MESMNKMARIGTDGLIDVADHATEAVIVALKETTGLVETGAHGAVRVAGVTSGAAIEEVERLRTQFLAGVRKVLDAAAGAAESE